METDIIAFAWVALAIISFGIAIWIFAIQGFHMDGETIKRCSEKGGKCKEWLAGSDGNASGAVPSILAVALLAATLLLFIADFHVGMLEIIFSIFGGLASFFYIGIQIIARRYCAICNYFHATSLALSGVAILVFAERSLTIVASDVVLALVIFISVVKILTILVNLSEDKDEAALQSEIWRNILLQEDHRMLSALTTGVQHDFPKDALINLTDRAADDAQEVVLALSIGCHFCATTLRSVTLNIDDLSKFWRIKLIFVGSNPKQTYAALKAITVITRSCQLMPYDARLSYLKESVLPFLEGGNIPLKHLKKIPREYKEVPVVSVPFVPFAPALTINGQFLDDSVNYPEKILFLPLARLAAPASVGSRRG